MEKLFEPSLITNVRSAISLITSMLQAFTKYGIIAIDKVDKDGKEFIAFAVDEIQMGLVFQNLINNAITFCNTQPKIEISSNEKERKWGFFTRLWKIHRSGSIY